MEDQPVISCLITLSINDHSGFPSYMHALGLDVVTANRMDERINQLKELEHWRALINDDKMKLPKLSLSSIYGWKFCFLSRKEWKTSSWGIYTYNLTSTIWYLHFQNHVMTIDGLYVQTHSDVAWMSNATWW